MGNSSGTSSFSDAFGVQTVPPRPFVLHPILLRDEPSFLGFRPRKSGRSLRQVVLRDEVFAASLAQKLNVGITAEALQSRSVLSTFIDQSPGRSH